MAQEQIFAAGFRKNSADYGMLARRHSLTVLKHPQLTWRQTVARRGLQSVGNIVAEVIALRGIGRQRSTEATRQAWTEAVGQPLAEMTRCGNIRRGRLEVVVANSLMMQELAYQRTRILAHLNKTMPELNIRDLRFRVGPVA